MWLSITYAISQLWSYWDREEEHSVNGSTDINTTKHIYTHSTTYRQTHQEKVITNLGEQQKIYDIIPGQILVFGRFTQISESHVLYIQLCSPVCTRNVIWIEYGLREWELRSEEIKKHNIRMRVMGVWRKENFTKERKTNLSNMKQKQQKKEAALAHNIHR